MDYKSIYEQIEMFIAWGRKHNKHRVTMEYIRTVCSDAIEARRAERYKFDGKSALEDFFRTRTTTLNKHNILTGALYLDKDNIYFGMDSFTAWLAINHRHPNSNSAIRAEIRKMGGSKKFFHFSQTGEDNSDEGRNMWYVPIDQIHEDAIAPANDTHHPANHPRIKKSTPT